MRALRTFLRRLSAIFGKKRPGSDLTAELESNIAMNVEDNQRRGMDPAEARRQALIQFGAIEQSRQSYREQETLPFLETLFQDTRYGLRLLRKNPGFTAIAVATLALGIGANSAIFSIVNGVLLRPLPYRDPGRLVTVANTAPGETSKDFGASPPDFRRLRQQNQTLTSLSAYFDGTFNLTGADRPERVNTEVVSAEFFTTLGVTPMLGRAFLPSEEKWGSHRVMVVSEAFWRSHLNADPNFSAKSLDLDGEPYQVIGVLPASFYSRTRDLQIWVPMAWKPKDNYDSHNNYFLFMIGRLKRGVTLAQASTDLNSIMLAIAQEFPENKGISAKLELLGESWLGPVKPALMTLLAAVGLVLLIACVNLANLLLARGAGRQKEIGIRSALGARRGRLLRQFITESVLLASLGGGVGLALAYFSLKLLPLAGNVLPRANEVHIDTWVLLFTVAISLATGVLFGLLPALRSSRTGKLNESLKEGRMAQAGEGRRIRAGLVISEVALALVLLIGSGLAIRSLQRLLHVDSGFAAEHVLTFQVSLPQDYDPNPDDFTRIGAPPRVAAFYREFLDNIEHLPGVKAAGAGSTLPLRGDNWGKLFTPLDRPFPTSIDTVPHVQYRAVAGHYLQALGIHLIKGRLLDERDQANSSFSVVVNETMARKYWPNEDPIGKMLMMNPPLNLIPAELIPKGFQLQKFRVVGVVADVHYGRLDQEPPPLVYASVFQHDFAMGPNFAVRTTGDPTALVSSVRDTLKQFDKNLPLADLSTMDEIMTDSTAQPRLEAVLLGLFGGLAMLLAAVGIYGVMSYTVSRRTSEIGVRMAVGADRGDVLVLICKQGLALAGAGLAAGIVLALAGTRLMTKILFGISPTDPMTFVSIIVLLGLVAALACYIPARRATRVDPMVALRYE